MEFVHYIFTIFNIGFADEAWLEDRLWYFQRYTIPSIRHQTNQNFIWVVILDGKTPADYIKRLYYATEFAPNIVFTMIPPAHIDSIYDTFPIAQDFIRKFLPKYTVELVVTSGIDSDDAVSVNWVEAVQKEVILREDDHNYLLDVIIEMDIDFRFEEYSLVNIDADPHASVTCTAVERSDNPKTIMAGMHGTLWNRDLKIRQSKHFQRKFCVPATCLHIVHGGNHGLTDNRGWRVSHSKPIEMWKEKHAEGYHWLDSLTCKR